MALASLTVILLLGIVFLIGSIHPFWAIIECAVSTKLSGPRKGLWILAMLLTWTLASFLYGLFATYSPALRRVTRGCALLMLLVLMACGYLFFTNAEFQEAFLKGVDPKELESAQTQAEESATVGSVPN